MLLIRGSLKIGDLATSVMNAFIPSTWLSEDRLLAEELCEYSPRGATELVLDGILVAPSVPE